MGIEHIVIIWEDRCVKPGDTSLGAQQKTMSPISFELEISHIIDKYRKGIMNTSGWRNTRIHHIVAFLPTHATPKPQISFRIKSISQRCSQPFGACPCWLIATKCDWGLKTMEILPVTGHREQTQEDCYYGQFELHGWCHRLFHTQNRYWSGRKIGKIIYERNVL